MNDFRPQNAKNQNEIVDYDDKLYESGVQNSKKLFLPGLDSYFSLSEDLEVEVITKDCATLSKCGNKSRKEIAELLTNTLLLSDKIAGFEWLTGQSLVSIFNVKNGTVKHTLSKDDLKDLIYLILRSSVIIDRIKWEFGKKYVEISYTNI